MRRLALIAVVVGAALVAVALYVLVTSAVLAGLSHERERARATSAPTFTDDF